MRVTHKELSKLIELCYEKKLPLFIWGAMGIGKSQTVRQTAKYIAEKLGREYIEYNKIRDKKEIEKNIDKYFILVDFRLTQIEPADIKGVPVPNNGSVVWKIPHAFEILTYPEAHGILFFDELNLAHPSIQASAYQIILDRIISEKPLSDNILVISAGNRLEDRANIFDMPSPLKNRFIHCELDVSVEDWLSWSMENNIDKRIVSFISSNNEFLFKFDTRQNENAFPTPRSWEYASKLISNIEDIEMVKKLVAYAVGEPTALRFYAHIKLYHKIDMNDYIANPHKIKEIRAVAEKLDSENPELTEKELIYAIATELVYRFKKTDDERLVEKGIEMATYLEPEFATFLLKSLINSAKDKSKVITILQNSKWGDVLYEKYAKYIL